MIKVIIYNMVYHNSIWNDPIYIVIKLVADLPKFLNSNFQNFGTKSI